MDKITEHQRYVYMLYQKHKTLDQIGAAYQVKFGTKTRLSREAVRSIIANVQMKIAKGVN